jgi:hypothetical protein
MSDPAESRVRESRTFRLDLVIAICALFVSSLATAASWWQSRIVAQQLSSQVWPYLSIETTVSGPEIAVAFSNDGLGPARVRSVVLSLDGVPRKKLTDVLRVIVPAKKRDLRGSFTDVESGSVIRVGGKVTLFRIADHAVAAGLIRNYRRFDIELCYCPIIPGDCWVVHKTASTDADLDPKTVAQCPDRRQFMYESGFAP